MSYLAELSKLVDHGRNRDQIKASKQEQALYREFVGNLLHKAVWVTYGRDARPKDIIVQNVPTNKDDVPRCRIDITVSPTMMAPANRVFALARRIWRNSRSEITRAEFDNKLDIVATKATMGAQLGRHTTRSPELYHTIPMAGDPDKFWVQQRVRIIPLRHLLLVGNAVEHSLIPEKVRSAVMELCKENGNARLY